MIFKHTEYKISCDGCYTDITDYTPAENVKDFKAYCRQMGINHKKHICESCELKTNNNGSRPIKKVSK